MGLGDYFLFFPGTTANLNVNCTFLIIWRIHWYVFHFYTTNSLGGVNAHKKRYLLTNLQTNHVTHTMRLAKYIILLRIMIIFIILDKISGHNDSMTTLCQPMDAANHLRSPILLLQNKFNQNSITILKQSVYR